MVARIAAVAAVAGLLAGGQASADSRPRLALSLAPRMPAHEAPRFASPSTLRAPPGFLDQIDLTHPIRVGGQFAVGPAERQLRVEGAVIVDGDIPGFATTLHFRGAGGAVALRLPLVQVSPGLIGGARTWEVRLRVFSTEF